MSTFQLDQLRTLSTLIEAGTFEAAAERLRITASAVSQRVKAMEQSAGQVLVQRTNPVRLTPAGDIVMRLARQVQLLEADATRGLVAGTSEGGRMTVPLAVNADSLATWFLEVLAELPASVDAVFDIHRDDEARTTALLRSGTVMAAVTATAEAVQGCTVAKLGALRYRAVCSPEFANRWLRARGERSTGTLDVAGLALAPVVNFDRNDPLQQKFSSSLLGSASAGPRHYIPASSEYARAIVLGLGWGMLPEQQCSTELSSGALLEIAPGRPIDVRLYWQRWNLASELLDAISAGVLAGAASRLHPF